MKQHFTRHVYPDGSEVWMDENGWPRVSAEAQRMSLRRELDELIPLYDHLDEQGFNGAADAIQAQIDKALCAYFWVSRRLGFDVDIENR